MAAAASSSAQSASLAAARASTWLARLSILAWRSSILAAASAFICAHLPRALVTGLGGGRLRRRLGRRDALLQFVELCGEVHASIPPCLGLIADLAAGDARRHPRSVPTHPA